MAHRSSILLQLLSTPDSPNPDMTIPLQSPTMDERSPNVNTIHGILPAEHGSFHYTLIYKYEPCCHDRWYLSYNWILGSVSTPQRTRILAPTTTNTTPKQEPASPTTSETITPIIIDDPPSNDHTIVQKTTTSIFNQEPSSIHHPSNSVPIPSQRLLPAPIQQSPDLATVSHLPQSSTIQSTYNHPSYPTHTQTTTKRHRRQRKRNQWNQQ